MTDLQTGIFDQTLSALGNPQGTDRAGMLHPFYSAQAGTVQLKREDGRIFTIDSSKKVQLGLRLTSVRPLAHAEYGDYQPAIGVGERLMLILLINDPAIPLDLDLLIRHLARTFGVRFLGLENDPIRALANAQVPFDELSIYPVQLRAMTIELEHTKHLGF